MTYDDALNITWLQNWNQAVGTSYDTGSPGSGRMFWSTANTWADNLVWGGFSDWRLPAIVDTGAPGCDYSYAAGTDCGFNVQTESDATVYSEMALQDYAAKDTGGFAVAARPGDVVAVVPEPQTYALLMLGLGAVMVAARRQPH